MEKPWLICFYMGAATNLNLQLKRLPAVLPEINVGMFLKQIFQSCFILVILRNKSQC